MASLVLPEDDPEDWHWPSPCGELPEGNLVLIGSLDGPTHHGRRTLWVDAREESERCIVPKAAIIGA